jgi:hypothetical protein
MKKKIKDGLSNKELRDMVKYAKKNQKVIDQPDMYFDGKDGKIKRIPNV